MNSDLTPKPDHADVTDHALEEWVGDFGMFHASHTELAALVRGPFERDRCFRALWHLRRCPTCRERLAAYIEEVVLDWEDRGKSLELFTGLLQHEEAVVRASAARASITLSADTSAVIEPVQRLMHDVDEMVRSDAAISLSQIEGAARIAPGEIAASASADEAGMQADAQEHRHLDQQWFGLLASWSLQPAIGVSPLALVESTYESRQAPIESLFTPRALEGSLAWAKGPLRIAAFYRDDRIETLRAIVGRQAESGAALMVLELSDGAGTTVSLTLSANQPSHLLTSPSVHGRLEHLRLRLSVADPE